ncbi:MAG: hypothetical protein TREMPRED_004869, partial [Tremellales sp. Tagirdzhanova-0007]
MTSSMGNTRSRDPGENIEQDHPYPSSRSEYSRFDVERELAFYGSYHATKGNKIIHFIFIPQIVWSTLILAAHLPFPGSHPITLVPGFTFQLNLALLLTIGGQAYYLLLDLPAGLLSSPVSLSMCFTATYLYAHPPSWLPYASSSVPFGWMMFTSSWIFQFIGHGVFEHRAPALMDNLVQALLLAPFFVFLQMMFSVFG